MKIIKHPIARLACIAVCLWIGNHIFPTTSAALAAGPSIYNLGTTSTMSDGYAVNEAGMVAGSSYNANTSVARAFRYDGVPGKGGTLRELGTLGGSLSLAYGVNDSGQVIGRAQNFAGFHAFRYDGTPGAGGVMRDLGSLTGFSGTSRARAINASGDVVGESRSASSKDHAFLYTGTPGAGGIMRDLGTLGGNSSVATGVNNSGQIVGYSNPIADDAVHAFLYTGIPIAGGAMQDLGTLGGNTSAARGINDRGQVTGSSSRSSVGLPTYAFRYDPSIDGGVIQDLGSLGGLQCTGNDVNNLGIVVGESETTVLLEQHAFIYVGTPEVDGHMIDLDSWLDANNSSEGSKWGLKSAQCITDSGWITGYGYYDPDGPEGVAAAQRAFLLDGSSFIPEPASAGMMLAAVAFIATRRQRLD